MAPEIFAPSDYHPENKVPFRRQFLGRLTRDVLNLIHELHGKGISLQALEPEITKASDMGRMVITVLVMVADMELKLISDRQRAGVSTRAGRSELMTRP